MLDNHPATRASSVAFVPASATPELDPEPLLELELEAPPLEPELLEPELDELPPLEPELAPLLELDPELVDPDPAPDDDPDPELELADGPPSPVANASAPPPSSPEPGTVLPEEQAVINSPVATSHPEASRVRRFIRALPLELTLART